MRKNDFGKYIYSFVFIAGCIAYGGLSFNKSYSHIESYLKENSLMDFSKNKQNISSIENIINENTSYKYDLIELYGYLNKKMNKGEINGFEYVTDKRGDLIKGNFWSNIHTVDSEPFAVSVKKLADDMELNNTKTLVINYPEKFEEDKPENYYSGIPFGSSKYIMEDYLTYIRKYRVPYLDLRETLKETDLEHEDIFFKTDHHWKPRAVFESFKGLVNKLNEDFEMNLDPEGYYRNIDNYNIEIYEDMMLGSSGRSTGINYSGKEEFELIYPKDDNLYNLSYKTGGSEAKYEGVFNETILSYYGINYIREDENNIYSHSLYDTYLHGVKKELNVVNKSNQEGPRVLIIGDSYSYPLGAFMTPICSKLDILWTKEFTHNLDEYARNGKYDLVIVAFYPSNMSEEFFNFYKN